MTVLPVIRDIWDPAQGPPPVQRARSTAVGHDFGALVWFCEQHIGWMDVTWNQPSY